MLKHLHMAEFVIVVILAAGGCGTKDLGEPYDEKTDAEKAKIALEAGDFDSAIELYEAALEAEPEAYQHFPLLAVAYAAKAGILLSETLKAQITGPKSDDAGSEGTTASGLNSSVASILPVNPTKAQIASLKKAVTTLTSMPPEHRTDGAVYPYAAGAAFQLSLFETMYSLLILQQFKSVTSTEKPTKEKLATMTDEEATAVLQSLDAAIANAPDTESGKAIKTIGAAKLDQIKATPGATDKERLKNFLEAG